MKRIISIILAVMMLCSFAPLAFAEDDVNLSDVQGHWAQEAIEYLAERGCLNQLHEGQTFEPDAYVTRNALVFILMSAFKFQAGNQEEFFKNVTALSWYCQPADMANTSSVSLGVGELANPSGYVSRHELAALVGLAAEAAGVQWGAVRAEKFADDAEIPLYVKNAVYLLAEKGIIKGVTSTTFAPNEYATRAQAAEMIYRALKLIEG